MNSDREMNSQSLPPVVSESGKGGKRGPFSRLYRGETAVDFVGGRKKWFTLSASVILIGLLALGIRGLNLGIDFVGGTSWQVVTPSVSVSQARSALTPLGLGAATIETLGSGSNRTLEVQDRLAGRSPAQAATIKTEVSNRLASLAHVSDSAVSLSDVGPTWGSTITNKALEALVVFFLAIGAYIALRFEWKMALAAIVAVAHDLVVTVGIYALSGFQVTPSTVVAVLTILGYSLYDTIVVFDRVLENAKALANQGRLTYTDTVNLSMNQVLMRSLNTSIVAILPILSVLVVGAELLGATTLQNFGLALFIGLTTGAYSSLFIASPLLAIMKEKEPRYTLLRQKLASKGRTGLLLTPAAIAAGSAKTFGTGTGAVTARPKGSVRSGDPKASKGGELGPASQTQDDAPPAAEQSDGSLDGGVSSPVGFERDPRRPPATSKRAAPRSTRKTRRR